MSIRRIPVRNAAKNEHDIIEGEIVDVLPDDHSVYVDRTGKTYDTAKGVRMGDLPQQGLLQVPRTTWYAVNRDDLVIVGYMNGPEGYVPMYERRNNAKNRGARLDALRAPEPDKQRRNGRERKAARAAGAPALRPDSGDGSGGTQS